MTEDRDETGTFEATAKDVLKRGPKRVVINSRGDSKIPDRALMENQIRPEIVFVRRDGWTLGAPAEFADAAFKTYRTEWAVFFEIANGTVRPIIEWGRR